MWDLKDSFRHYSGFRAIHHLPLAKCLCGWRRLCRKLLKHSKMFCFLLHLRSYWLFPLFLSITLMLVIFMLVVPFQIFIGFCYKIHIPIKKKGKKKGVAVSVVQVFDDVRFFVMESRIKTQLFVYVFFHQFLSYRCRLWCYST